MDLELVRTEPNSTATFNKSAEYTKINPSGKIPAFEGANGFVLSEVIALAIYGMFFIFSKLVLEYSLFAFESPTRFI